MRYGMVIDLTRCAACHTCAVACKQANNLPNSMWWNKILTVGGEGMDTASGTYPNGLELHHIPIACQHCDNPPCVKACPVGATYKRAEDGIVVQDCDRCIGCRMCSVACPYSVRAFNWKKPEYYVDHALGDYDAPKHQNNAVEKCTFCANRIARGEKPACMELCPGRARYWGDLDDPNSEASIALHGRMAIRLLEDRGTEPNVYYLK